MCDALWIVMKVAVVPLLALVETSQAFSSSSGLFSLRERRHQNYLPLASPVTATATTAEEGVVSSGAVGYAANGGITVLRCDKISKAFTGNPQFEEISLNLARGQRVGLIGVNGAGKSTFMKCLSMLESVDAGTIETASNARVIYVDQEPEWEKPKDGGSVVRAYEALFQGDSPEATANRKYFHALAPANFAASASNGRSPVTAEGIDTTGNEEGADLLTDAMFAMDAAGVGGSSWEYHDRGIKIAENLNIGNEFMYRDVHSLSGGEKKRLGLAAALLMQPDILLLDEPTNHLDIDAQEFLVNMLAPGGGIGGGGGGSGTSSRDLTVLLVTHDRYFLDRTCSEILELDRASLYRYPGSYAKYLELKAARIAAQDAEAARARTKLRKEGEWMARQPQARQAKSKARIDQFYELTDKAKSGYTQASGGKIDVGSAMEKDRQKRLGGVIAEFKGARFVLDTRTPQDPQGGAPAGVDAAGQQGKREGAGTREREGEGEEVSGKRVLLSDFTYSFRQRDRIGVVGYNGAGKSTFLKVLTGQLELTSGSVKIGDTVRIGYYEQTGLRVTKEQEAQTVLKFVQEAVQRASAEDGAGPAGGRGPSTPKLVVQQSEKLGRRKQLAGKESAISVKSESESAGGLGMELSSGGGGGSSSIAFSEREAMSLLRQFLFPPHRWSDRVNQLSGGERRRLQLLQVLAASPNVLLLDEPTNDLDIATLQALEDYLAGDSSPSSAQQSNNSGEEESTATGGGGRAGGGNSGFQGCLVVVSHDNFFMNRVAEHLFVFEGDGVVRDFQGDYSEYVLYRREEKLRKEKKPALSPTTTTSSSLSGESKTVQASGQAVVAAGASSASSSSSSPPQRASSALLSGQRQTPQSSVKAAVIEITTDEKVKEEKRGLNYLEKKEMNKLEKEMEKLETKIAAVELRLSDASADGTKGYSELADMSNELHALKAKLEVAEERWLELQEKQ